MGRLPELTGFNNARVLVITPSVLRWDRLAALLDDLCPDHAASFWLTDQAALEADDLSAPVWLRAGELYPLVPAERLRA